MKPSSSEKKSIRIAAVIPALNEEEFIGGLVSALQKNNYKEKEIIVVDDGSTDKTVEIAKRNGARVLINNPGRRGPAFGRNRGARESNADVICLLDADGIIEDNDFLGKIAKEFRDPAVVAAYLKYKTKPDTLIEAIVTDEEGITFEPRAIRKEVFLSVGGHPEIGFGEDRIFAKKVLDFIRKNNLRENVSPGTFIIGHSVHSLGELYKQAKWYGKTGILFLKAADGNILKNAFSTYGRLLYFLSLAGALLLFPFMAFFALPAILFLAMSFGYFFSNIKKPVHTLKVFTNIVFGIGLLHGLVIYFFSKKKTGGA